MDQPTIRPAEPADLTAVRALLVETWHDTYDALIGVDKVTAITDDWHSLENLERQLRQPDSSFLVAKAEGRVIGHLFANADRPPVLFLSRLYVLPRLQRRGIGGRLLSAAVARYPGASVIQLLVEADNAKGVGFYRREGFVTQGESLEGGIRHIRMEKPLAPTG